MRQFGRGERSSGANGPQSRDGESIQIAASKKVMFRVAKEMKVAV
jgi:nucleoid DNA-binding protein